jgi:hypothetical protein
MGSLLPMPARLHEQLAAHAGAAAWAGKPPMARALPAGRRRYE